MRCSILPSAKTCRNVKNCPPFFLAGAEVHLQEEARGLDSSGFAPRRSLLTGFDVAGEYPQFGELVTSHNMTVTGWPQGSHACDDFKLHKSGLPKHVVGRVCLCVFLFAPRTPRLAGNVLGEGSHRQ